MKITATDYREYICDSTHHAVIVDTGIIDSEAVSNPTHKSIGCVRIEKGIMYPRRANVTPTFLSKFI